MKKELKNYEILKKELTNKFGRIYWYNDKRKSFERRIKIIGLQDDFKRNEMFNFLKEKGYKVEQYLNNKGKYHFYNYKCLTVKF